MTFVVADNQIIYILTGAENNPLRINKNMLVGKQVNQNIECQFPRLLSNQKKMFNQLNMKTMRYKNKNLVLYLYFIHKKY